MSPRSTKNPPTPHNGASDLAAEIAEGRRPFRAADVLTGTIDKRRAPAPGARGRKQISAQLEPAQLRLLGELHARLNATTTTRIEKSDLVGLGIELLAAVLDGAGHPTAEGRLAPAPDPAWDGGADAEWDGDGIADLSALRTYLRTRVRAYKERG